MNPLLRWVLDSEANIQTQHQRATHTYVIGQPGTGGYFRINGARQVSHTHCRPDRG